MPITVAALSQHADSGTAADTVATGSATPTADAVIVFGGVHEVDLGSAVAFGAANPVSGGPNAWTTLEEIEDGDAPGFDGGAGFSLNGVFSATSAASSPTAFAITFDGGTSDGWMSTCAAQISGADSETPAQTAEGSMDGTGTVVSATLSSTPATDSVVVGFIGAGDDGGSGITAPTFGGQSMTELYSQAQTFTQAGIWYRIIDGTESGNVFTTTAAGGGSLGNAIAFVGEWEEAGGGAATASATWGGWTASATGTVTSANSPDILVHAGEVDVPAGGTTVTLPTAVASLANAIELIAGNRQVGAGPDGSAANQNADDMSVRMELTAVDTLTFSKPSGSNTTRVYWQVWEYVGPSGGNNEFIVRSRNTVTLDSATTSDSFTLDNTVTDIDRCIPFLSGVDAADTSSGSNEMGARVRISSTTTGAVASLTGGGSFDMTAQVVTAEFTGTNWGVLHGASYNNTADSGSVTLVEDADGVTGAAQTVTWAEAIIASWGYVGDTTNIAIADNWPTLEPSATPTSSAIDYTFHSDHDGTDDDVFVHVLTHADMVVTRYSGTGSAAGANTYDITSAGLADLDRAAILGTATSSGGGTAYGRGWKVFKLNSLTQAQDWCHRSGNTVATRVQVIDFAGLETATAAGETGTASASWSGWSATADGTRERTGTAAATWSGWSASASGTVEGDIEGTANATWSGWTGAASGERGRTGTASAAWSGWSATATGAVAGGQTGTAAATWSGWSASAAGARGRTGTASAAWSGWTGAASGERGRTGTASATWSGWSASAVGQVAGQGNGTANATWSGWAATATGRRDRTGTGSASWNAWAASAVGQRKRTGVAAAAWAGWSASATGTVDGAPTGTASGVWSGWTAQADGTRERRGVAAATWPGWTATAAATVDTDGVAASTWDGWTSTATGVRGRTGTAVGTWAGWTATVGVEPELVGGTAVGALVQLGGASAALVQLGSASSDGITQPSTATGVVTQ